MEYHNRYLPQVTTLINNIASYTQFLVKSLSSTIFYQRMYAHFLLAYVLFWYSTPYFVFANIHLDKANLTQRNTSSFDVNSYSHSPHPIFKSNVTKSSKVDADINNSLTSKNVYLQNMVSDDKKDLNNQESKFPSHTSIMDETKGNPSDILFNLKPKFADKFEDASPSKCYILSFSGGGAKGSFSSGLLHGLAMIYRYHGIKLRWDVTTGISIGSLNTIWSLFHLPGHSTHFSTEGAYIWKNFSHKNVHNCKSTLLRNAPNFIFKFLKYGRKTPSYLCSTYPMLIYMRHLLQNRKRFKGSHWSVLAYNFKYALPYFFNEEIPATLLPSIIRASSSFPLVLEAADVAGLGIFGDGGISKSLDLQNGIHRCFQTGKAKSDEDIVIDIISTSYIDKEYFPTLDPKYSKTMFEVVYWFLAYYSISSLYQQNEIIQTIRRHPNVRFRHFLSHLDKEDSVVHELGIFDFVPKLMKKALSDGAESGFYNLTMFNDFWTPLKRNISPSSDWRPYGDDKLIIPKSSDYVSNPDSDAFVEFPELENVPNLPPPINIVTDETGNTVFNLFYIQDTSIGKDFSRMNSFRKNISKGFKSGIFELMIEIHRNVLSIRFIESIREFVRLREELLLLINENKADFKRRTNYLKRVQNFRNQFNNRENNEEMCTLGEFEDQYLDDRLSSIPFFQSSRTFLYDLMNTIKYGYTLKNEFKKKHSKQLKHRKLLKKESKYRKLFNNAVEIYYKYKQKLEGLYDEYDKLMEPINIIYDKMLLLTKKCNLNKRNIPILFPFLEGEDSKSLIWSPSNEYSYLIRDFKQSTLNLLSKLYPDFDWNSNPPREIAEDPSRMIIWKNYVKSLKYYIMESQDSFCWISNPEIEDIVSDLRKYIYQLTFIKSRHFEIVGKITNYHLMLSNIGVITRCYSANIETLFRKNSIKHLDTIESIFHKTSYHNDTLESIDEYPSGLSPSQEFENIKEIVKKRFNDFDLMFESFSRDEMTSIFKHQN